MHANGIWTRNSGISGCKYLAVTETTEVRL